MGLDEYKVGKAAGRGKFSTVYRAKRLSDDCTVALKKIDVGTFVLFIGLSDWIICLDHQFFQSKTNYLLFIYICIISIINVIYCFSSVLVIFY